MSEVSEVAKSMNFNREVSVTSVGKTDKNTFLRPRFAQKPNADSALFRFNNAKNAYNLICKVPFSLQTLLYTLPMERVYIIQTISNVCRQERIYHILSWSKDVANATAFTCGCSVLLFFWDVSDFKRASVSMHNHTAKCIFHF